jgi:hypothetical protein
MGVLLRLLALAAFAAFATAALAQSPVPSGTPARLDARSTSVFSDDPPVAVFLNTYTGAGYWTYPRGQWVRVDLKPLGVPADATAAIIHGTLIISMGAGADFGLVSVHFRRPGTTADCANTPNYTEITGLPWAGQRTPFSDTVPLKNGEFEVCIRTLWGSPPNMLLPAPWEASFGAYPSFAVNARLRGWTN